MRALRCPFARVYIDILLLSVPKETRAVKCTTKTFDWRTCMFQCGMCRQFCLLRMSASNDVFTGEPASFNIHVIQLSVVRDLLTFYICSFCSQNLPELQLLDLAYNSLPNFDFNYCDQVILIFLHLYKLSVIRNQFFQVGTLSALRVNVSHNDMFELSTNQTTSGRTDHGKKAIEFILLISYTSHQQIQILHLNEIYTMYLRTN